MGRNYMKAIEQLKNTVIQGDCLIEMKNIPDKSIDMILCDLPYGTTACKWDTIIPFEPLWEQYKRIIKDNGAIVLTASQPFTSALVKSNQKMFKYEWIWEKSRASNFVNAKYSPLKYHENILIFGNKTKYNPQMTIGEKYSTRHNTKRKSNGIFGNAQLHSDISIKKEIRNTRFPNSIIKIKSLRQQSIIHPTQKPVALFEYLIKTYTNEGDLVLDNAAGSGTTGIACKNLNRNYILIEKEPQYIEIINKRLSNNI